MWKKSKPGDYTAFRTFIFGITNQAMFPNGVLYEDVSDKPFSFRGESGANDSMARTTTFIREKNLNYIVGTDTPLRQLTTNYNASYTSHSHSPRFPFIQTRQSS